MDGVPHGYMLVMCNRDAAGVIGRVGTTLGERGINISRFHLVRSERGGKAMAAIEIDAPVESEMLEALHSFECVFSAQAIEL